VCVNTLGVYKMAKFTRGIDRIVKAQVHSRTVIQEAVHELISLLQKFIDCYSNEVDVSSR
jgi:hypothetical protein